MASKWNPFTAVDHNEHRWWRVAFHAAHVAIGVPVAVVAWLVHAPFAWTMAAAFVVALINKCVWIDWRRTSGRLLHWTGLHGLDDPWDFASDAGLTLLGALSLSVSPWVWLCYYPLSVVNGT